MPVYRFRNDFVSAGELLRNVGAGLSFTTPTPAYQDITATAAQLPDLQEFMLKKGMVLVATDPVNTPTQQTLTDLGSGGVKYWIDEDFVTGNVDTDEIGLHNWRSNTSGTGADISIVPGELNRTGIIRLGAGTAAASKSDVHIGDSVDGGIFLLNSTQNQWDHYWDVRPGGSLSLLNLQLMQFGWGLEWTLVDELLNGVYVRFDPTQLDTTWKLVNANGGARTLATGITSAPVLNTWSRVGIRITYPGGVPTVQFLHNGVAEGTAITANFPTSALGVGAKIDGVTGAGTEAFVHLDRCEVKQAA